jgi:hypothetical protein
MQGKMLVFTVSKIKLRQLKQSYAAAKGLSTILGHA